MKKGGEVLKDTRDLILEASLKVFSAKGYASATTLEIAKEAGVAEMTLFRQFQTKNNLFIETVKQALGLSFVEDPSYNPSIGLSDLVMELLHRKLTLISQNIMLIRMLIREKLLNTLPENLDVTQLISKQVIAKVTTFIENHQLHIDAQAFAEMTVGLLLRYAVMEDKPIYHLLETEEQKKYLKSYIQILNI